MAPVENIITFEDIMKGQDEQGGEQDDFVDIDTEKKTDEDEEQYHTVFVEEIRKKEQLDQIKKDEKQVNFDEEDDKFIIGLQDAENAGTSSSAQSYLDKEKRKADKKNLKFLD